MKCFCSWPHIYWVTLSVLFFSVVYSSNVPNSELEGLRRFYDNLGGDEWKVKDWFIGEDPCKWHGIACTSINGIDHIESISMSDNNLTGVIPTTIGSDFPYLISLDMPSNNISGALPVLPPKTYAISFRFNKVTTLPGNLCELKELKFAHLDFNEIYDHIPSCFAEMTKLVVFGVTSNHLYGSLPSDWSNMENLETLMLGGNRIEGFIPTSLLQLPLLETLDLTGNKLSGDINAMAKTLKELDLGGTEVDGKIIKFLENNEDEGNYSIVYLDVSSTQTYGNIDNVISSLYRNTSLSELRLLSIDNSQITGVIPISSLESIRDKGSMIRALSYDNCPMFCGDMKVPIEDQDDYKCIEMNMLSLSSVSDAGTCFSRIEVSLIHYPLEYVYDFVDVFKISNLECAEKNDFTKSYPADYYGNNIEGILICNGHAFDKISDIAILLNGAEITKHIRPPVQINISDDNPIIHDSTTNNKEIEENYSVEIVVTGMSKCPDFSGFLTDILIPSYPQIENLNSQYSTQYRKAIDISISFIVQEMNDYTTGVWSMHGQVEVVGDSAFECANKYGGTDMVIELSKCLYETEDDINKIPLNIESCFDKAIKNIQEKTMEEEYEINYDLNEIIQCTYSDGFQLVMDGNKKAVELGAIWSPTIYINNELVCRYNAPGADSCRFSNSDEFMQMVIDKLSIPE